MKPMNTLRALVVFSLTLTSLVFSQTPPQVEFDLRLPNYDVIYLSDLVDIRNLRLAENIPDMSIEMRTVPPGQSVMVYMRLKAAIQLRGESSPDVLVVGQTNDFSLDGVRRLSSKDLSATGARGISVTTTQRASEALRTKLEDYIKRFPTAPVGQYFFELEVYHAVNRTLKLGEVRKIISVRNASEGEVNVTLISPEPGANVPTPFPTFTWTSEKPEVVLFVYEKLPIHRSAEEAVTGVPYLQRELTGVSTFSYPADAARRLENAKSYYWFVETKVLTSRGDLTRRSEIRLFRVHAGGASPLARLFNSLPGSAGSTLGQLMQMGWNQSGGITLDGRPVTQEELGPLFQQLVKDNVEVKVSVDEQ